MNSLACRMALERCAVGKLIDMTGQVFGKWTVLDRAENAKNRQTHWFCRCKCGRESVVLGINLRHGKSTQCADCRNRANGAARSKGSGHIYEARLKAGLTQTELAVKSGLSLRAISNAERESRVFAKPKTQIKFNEALPEHRQYRPPTKKAGIKEVVNSRVVVALCTYCGKIVNQRDSNANRGHKPFCNQSHATLYRYHGALKPVAPTPTPRYTGNEYERVKGKRDLWAGANRVLEANRNKSKGVGT